MTYILENLIKTHLVLHFKHIFKRVDNAAACFLIVIKIKQKKRVEKMESNMTLVGKPIIQVMHTLGMAGLIHR